MNSFFVPQSASRSTPGRMVNPARTTGRQARTSRAERAYSGAASPTCLEVKALPAAESGWVAATRPARPRSTRWPTAGSRGRARPTSPDLRYGDARLFDAAIQQAVSKCSASSLGRPSRHPAHPMAALPYGGDRHLAVMGYTFAKVVPYLWREGSPASTTSGLGVHVCRAGAVMLCSGFTDPSYAQHRSPRAGGNQASAARTLRPDLLGRTARS